MKPTIITKFVTTLLCYSMNEHIHPYKGNHSVKEAVISFFVQPSILAPEGFRGLLTEDGIIRDNYQKFETIKEVSVDISLGRDTQVKKVNDVGFKLTGFREGRTSKVIQGLHQATRTVFTFNELEYVSWDDFLNLTIEGARQIAGKLQGHLLRAFSLMYIDEFYFDETASYDARELFNLDSRTLPKGLEDSPLVDYQLVLNKNIGEHGYSDSLGIKVLDAGERKTIRIINSLTFPLKNRAEWTDYMGSGVLTELLNSAHQSNKMMLNDILRKEVTEGIGICVY